VTVIRAEGKAAARPETDAELQTVDAELRKRDENIKNKLEDGIGTISEWMMDLEEKFARREAEARKKVEAEFDLRLAGADRRFQEDLKRRDERVMKLEAEYDKKLDEIRRKFDAELRKKDEDILRTVETKNQEKETAVLEVYKVIETQSEIITKLMEKNEKLMLEVLSELNISIEELRKMMETNTA
jgi:hypothetical protein